MTTNVPGTGIGGATGPETGVVGTGIDGGSVQFEEIHLTEQPEQTDEVSEEQLPGDKPIIQPDNWHTGLRAEDQL